MATKSLKDIRSETISNNIPEMSNLPRFKTKTLPEMLSVKEQ